MKIGNKLLSSTILLCAFTFQVFAQTSINEEKNLNFSLTKKTIIFLQHMTH